MAIVGYVAIALLVVAILLGILLAVMSGGDVRRYFKIRKM